MSIDRGTVRWQALTAAGANGPIAWFVDETELRGRFSSRRVWFEVAREHAPGRLLALSEAQARILHELAEMTL